MAEDYQGAGVLNWLEKGLIFLFQGVGTAVHGGMCFAMGHFMTDAERDAFDMFDSDGVSRYIAAAMRVIPADITLTLGQALLAVMAKNISYAWLASVPIAGTFLVALKVAFIGIAFDAEDNLYVVDSYNSRVQKFTKDGGFLSSFGSHGAGEGEMDIPWGITVDPKGDVYVADWGNERIQRFSPSGEFLAELGESGNGDGQFNRPTSVAVDADGYMYVADWGNERVQVLDSKGGFVQKLKG